MNSTYRTVTASRISADADRARQEIRRNEALLGIFGYRINEDGSETRVWVKRADGSSFCVHNAATVCKGCIEADERLQS